MILAPEQLADVVWCFSLFARYALLLKERTYQEITMGLTDNPGTHRFSPSST
jgi:hypothetical protein